MILKIKNLNQIILGGMSMKKLFSILAVAMLAFTGCGNKKEDTKAAAADKTVIKVGVIAPLTGDVAQYGNSAKEGIQLRVDEINAEGGINGKKIELIIEDDKGDAQEAINAYKKLTAKDKVDVVLGAVTSGPSNAIAVMGNTDKVPMISPTGTSQDITLGKPYIFRTTYTDPFQGGVMGRYAAKKGYKKVAVMTNTSSDYSTGLAKSFKEEAEKAGIQIVEEKYTADDKDFKSILTNIKNAGVEAIFVPDYYNTIGLIATQSKELGITAQFLGGDGWDGVQKNFASVTEGALFASQYAADDTSAIVQDFIKVYKAKYNKEPDLFAGLGYDTGTILINAIKNAKDLSSDSIKDALKATDMELVTGKMTFDENNDPKKIATIIEVKGGKLTFKEKSE